MKKLILLLLLVLGVNVNAQTFHSQDSMVVGGVTHYYHYYTNDTLDAPMVEDYVQQSSIRYKGLKGYMVTVTSPYEDSVIVNLIRKVQPTVYNTGVLMGGKKIAGLWYWNAGPEYGTMFYSVGSIYWGSGNVPGVYNNFHQFEPNNLGSLNEYYLNYWGSDQWNDIHDTIKGDFVIEYSTNYICLDSSKVIPTILSTSAITGDSNNVDIDTINYLKTGIVTTTIDSSIFLKTLDKTTILYSSLVDNVDTIILNGKVIEIRVTTDTIITESCKFDIKVITERTKVQKDSIESFNLKVTTYDRWDSLITNVTKYDSTYTDCHGLFTFPPRYDTTSTYKGDTSNTVVLTPKVINTQNVKITRVDFIDTISINCVIDTNITVVIDTIVKEPEYHFPTAFTPNGDGVNDLYRFYSYEKQFHFAVFNRWGQEVYRQTDENDGWWDGTTQGVVHKGAYSFIFYKVTTEGYKGKLYKGLINVL